MAVSRNSTDRPGVKNSPALSMNNDNEMGSSTIKDSSTISMTLPTDREPMAANISGRPAMPGMSLVATAFLNLKRGSARLRSNVPT